MTTAPTRSLISNRPRQRLAAAAANAALVSAILVFIAAAVIPLLTGGTARTVMTGSMSPSLPPGHILIYQPVDTDSLEIGDVIAYQPDGNATGGVPITHRVIDLRSSGGHVSLVIVQGDANPVPDKPVRPDQVIGKMVYFIPLAGLLRVLAFQAGFGWLPDVFSIGLLAYGGFLLVRGLKPDRVVNAPSP